MFRRFLAAFLLLSAIGVAGVLLAEPAKTEMVSYKSGDETVQGFLATPGGSGKISGNRGDSRMVGIKRLGEGRNAKIG